MTLLKTEEDAGLFEKDTYLRFGKDVVAHKTEIQELLAGLKKEGKEIIGIGAPAKGNTLLNYCEITPKIMSCLAEKSDLKIGLYTPGTHIEVVKESTALERNPDLAFMLSWNIADELIPKLKKLGFNGKFVVPSPKLRIVE